MIILRWLTQFARGGRQNALPPLRPATGSGCAGLRDRSVTGRRRAIGVLAAAPVAVFEDPAPALAQATAIVGRMGHEVETPRRLPLRDWRVERTLDGRIIVSAHERQGYRHWTVLP
jgi:hypothetical protein